MIKGNARDITSAKYQKNTVKYFKMLDTNVHLLKNVSKLNLRGSSQWTTSSFIFQNLETRDQYLP